MIGYQENELEADPGLWRRLMHRKIWSEPAG